MTGRKESHVKRIMDTKNGIIFYSVGSGKRGAKPVITEDATARDLIPILVAVLAFFAFFAITSLILIL